MNWFVHGMFCWLVSVLLLTARGWGAQPSQGGETAPTNPVGWVAVASDEADPAELATALALNATQREAWSRHGVGNVQLFSELLEGQTVVLLVCDLQANADPDEAWEAAQADAELVSWFAAAEAGFADHPRAGKQTWVRCETICQLRPKCAAGDAESALDWAAAVTRIRPEKEAEYRTLHYAVWPAVVEAIGDGGVPRFDLFLIDLGDEIYEFYWLAQREMPALPGNQPATPDPVTKRWWSFTDPCQLPLPAAAERGEIWEPMEEMASALP